MCQQFDGESRYVTRSEMADIRERYVRHESGQAPLTDSEIKDLAIRMLMLREH